MSCLVCHLRLGDYFGAGPKSSMLDGCLQLQPLAYHKKSSRFLYITLHYATLHYITYLHTYMHTFIHTLHTCIHAVCVCIYLYITHTCVCVCIVIHIHTLYPVYVHKFVCAYTGTRNVFHIHIYIHTEYVHTNTVPRFRKTRFSVSQVLSVDAWTSG